MRIIVTGGAGFIGSAVCRFLAGRNDCDILNIDKLTYAADLCGLEAVSEQGNYRFRKEDICNKGAIEKLFADFRPTAVMHLAAESHVDRSIDGPAAFIQTNIVGTFTLLEVARAYFEGLTRSEQNAFRFHHVSTDEVYGALGDEGYFTEETAYAPSSPYSASKASSDHLVYAWYQTYGLPVLISNCSNNFGPYQFPEKLIPLMTIKALQGEKLPIYGKGLNIRDWLHVDDHAEALFTILTRGRVGEKYNVGGCNEIRNLDLVRTVFETVSQLKQSDARVAFEDVVEFVEDRPGHDWRYAIDPSKMRDELGWSPKYSFETGLRQTVRWYVDHQSWWEPFIKRQNALDRSGLGVEVRDD